MKFKNKAFTLAEVLITLAVIGVVAAISIPSVISNSQQTEFKTGLKKAVSVLNSAITMNMALDGESPYENKDLVLYLQRHMAVLKSTKAVPWVNTGKNGTGGENNTAFYTTDGMRFEFNDSSSPSSQDMALHESGVKACTRLGRVMGGQENRNCGGCGSYGLKTNPDNTTKPPCAFLVDVNGDKKPTPANINCKSTSCQSQNKYFQMNPNGKNVKDIFTILVTESRAVPYGVVAQKAMYDGRK